MPGPIDFKVEMVEDDQPPTSWFFATVGNSRLLNWIGSAILRPINERFDGWLLRRFPMRGNSAEKRPDRNWLTIFLWVLFALVVILGLYYAGGMLRELSLAAWGEIGLGLAATLLRVVIALIIALAWTVPVGVAVGTNRKLSDISPAGYPGHSFYSCHCPVPGDSPFCPGRIAGRLEYGCDPAHAAGYAVVSAV